MNYNIFSSNREQTTLYSTSWNTNHYYSSVHNINSQLSGYEEITTTPYFCSMLLQQNAHISTDKVYQVLNEKSLEKYNSFFYPMAVRYISSQGTYVVERPPFQLEVDYRMGSAYSSNPKMPPVKIWVPWTIMVFSARSFAVGNFGDVELYFSDGPLQSMDDQLVPCFYPNTYTNGRICFSNSLNDFADVLNLEELKNINISYIYNYIFNNYMMGGWNSDLGTTLLHYIGIAKGSLHTVDSNIFDNYPTLKLFLFPASNQEFYDKLSGIFPKEFFSKVKRFYKKEYMYFRTTTSSERLITRNFGIFAAFTLEQKLNFISEIKHFVNNVAKERHSLSSIITSFDEKHDADTTNENIFASINSDSAQFFEYDYDQKNFHVYIYNYGSPLQHSSNVLSKISTELYSSLISDMIYYFNKKESIAFAINLQTQTYDIILNYSPEEYLKEIIDDVVKKAQKFLDEYSTVKAKSIACRTVNDYLKNLTPERVESFLGTFLV